MALGHLYNIFKTHKAVDNFLFNLKSCANTGLGPSGIELSESQHTFIKSVSNFRDSTNSLSAKQVNAVRAIWSKVQRDYDYK